MGDVALQHPVRGEPDGVEHAFGFEIIVYLRRGEGRVSPEIETDRACLVAIHDGNQHVAPSVGAVDVAGAQGAALQVAELVEHEQRVIAGAAEVAVVGRAFLLAMGRADGAVHVEHDQLRRLAVVNPVDPLARQVRKGSEVVVGRQQLGLEPPHLAGRGAAALDRLAADDPAHGGIAPEPVGVVHVLVTGEATIDRLTQETDDAVPAVSAGSAVCENFARQWRQPEGVVEFAIGEQTGVGGDPRSVELQLQAAVENGPQGPPIRFTLRVPHPSRPPFYVSP